MRRPEIWIAFLRIVVGVWFLKAVWTKLTISLAWGIVPYVDVAPRFINFHPKRIAEFAAGNPIDWYRRFLEEIVLPHAAVFARLQAYAEVIVGVALVLGLCVGAGALLGLLLTLNYGLATQWMSFGQQGFHVLLIASMVVFLGARAGRVWGLDGIILRVAPPARRRWLAATATLLAFAVVFSFSSAALAADVRLFVTNEKSDNVTVIDPAAQKVVATIPVGRRPRGIAVNPDGSKVFVANSNSDDVRVIDAKQLRVIDTLPAGKDPEGMTVDQRGLLYVVNENDSALTIIDPAARKIVKRLEVGTEPETAVLSPDGRWVAVSNETSNEVHFLDTSRRVIVGKVAVPANPRGMRFTADSRRLYVASEKANAVSIVDVEQRKVVQSAPTGGERPVDIVFCPEQARIYVSHGGSGEVRILDQSLKSVGAVAVGPRAWWMAMTPDQRFLYVTVGRANEVVALDTQTNQVSARISAGTLPWGIAAVALK